MGSRVFLVYGAGAMGSLFGGLLSSAYPTYLINRKAHVEAIRKKGLEIEGKTQGTYRPKAVTDLAELSDLLARDGKSITHCLIFTKAYDTEKVLKELSSRQDIIDEKVIIISLQNGLDNERMISEMMPANPIIGGYCCHGVIHDRAGHIVHTGPGATIVGPYNNISIDEVKEFSRNLAEVGIPNSCKDTIRKEIFKKVVLNAAINSLTAILDIPNGELLEHEETKELMKNIVAEGCMVAGKMDMDICPVTVLGMVEDVARRTCLNQSSMLQDIRKGKRTEIDSINGAIVRLAQESGVEAPINETLTLLVRAKQAKGDSLRD